MRANKLILLLAVILVGSGFYLWISSRATQDYKCPDCNVILISVDTLRADHLGCYGYHAETTPNIDRFRRDAVLFQTAISQAPSTAPSHGSIFTSLIPSVHGALFSRKQGLSPGATTIAEILKSGAYRTASFNGGAQINASFRFDRGFEIYQSYTAGDYQKEFMADRVKEAIQWIENFKDEKQFLFLHSYEVHHPYSPAEKWLKEPAISYKGKLPKVVTPPLLRALNKGKEKIEPGDKEYIVALYDAELRSMDAALGDFFNHLKKLGLYDKSLIILTSDHGEEFGEHGSLGWHSHTLYDELLKVPLIIKFPKQIFAGETIDHQVRSLDIAPTILDVLSIQTPSHYQGSSLVPLVQGSDEFDQFAPSQKDSKNPSPPAALRTKRWKLNMKRLFDISNDPLETQNVADENPEAIKSLRARLDQMTAHDIGAAGTAEIDSETLEQLKTLGYID